MAGDGTPAFDIAQTLNVRYWPVIEDLVEDARGQVQRHGKRENGEAPIVH